MGSRASGPVLVVEDNHETRGVLERILAVSGYWATSVDGGRAALAYLLDPENPLPVVIVLDLHLPDMDGRTLLREIKRFPRVARIPVIVYSSDTGTVAEVAACVRKGSDDPDVLLSAIATCAKR
jgi:CheY-like chemotaxis protein